MRKARLIIAAALVVLLAACGLLLWGAGSFLPKPSLLKDGLPLGIDMRLKDFTLNEFGGDRSLTLDAENAHYYKAEDLFVLANLVADIEETRNKYKISAAAGRYEQTKKIVTMSDGVLAEDANGYVLKSDNLTYDFATKLLRSPKAFVLTSADMELRGTAFVVDMNTRGLKVDGRVHLTIFDQDL